MSLPGTAQAATPSTSTTIPDTVLQPQDLELDDAQRQALLSQHLRELSLAVDNHKGRQQFLAKLLKAYKALPEQDQKNFPWPGASNIVVPIVAIAVDTVAARLQRAVLGAKDPVEAHINTQTPFIMTVPPDPNNPQAAPAPAPVPLTDKDVRDWAAWYLRTSGGRDRLRTIFSDMPLYGDAFVSPAWIEEKRTYHAYNAEGAVVALDVPGYTGVRWFVHSPSDIFWPTGYDEWEQLPGHWIRLRYSRAELITLASKGAFKLEDVLQLISKQNAKQREDERRKVERKTEQVEDTPGEIYELFEYRGTVEIPPSANTPPNTIPQIEEVVLTISLDHRMYMRGIYNPYFGKSRHFVKVPFLAQPHELTGMGVAEMALPFQKEASTSHNQVIDAATAANAGITVVSNETNIGPNEEVFPGKTLTTDGDPNKGMAVFHLSEPSVALGAVEEKAFFMAEKRTGVSVYNMGMESPTVGSRATATGTTALINEGNQRFWVSIDDMRFAIEELLYLTIQQEQQMRPEGYYYEAGRYIQFPPGDPRQSLALRLSVSSESVNRDIEVQQMQLLITVVNDYYARLNQAMMLIANPQFPPIAKMMAMQVMEAAGKLIKKFVERFDIEDIDAVVPTVMQAMQAMSGMMQQAQNNAAGTMGAPPGQQPPAPGGGPGGPAPQTGGAPPFGRAH